MLRTDGTYQVSSERGTYSVKNDQIILSESKIRGPGRLQNGNQIVFEYEYNGWKHTVTYLCGDCVASDSAKGTAKKPIVSMDVLVKFPSEYAGYAGWINTASLLPEGENQEVFIKEGYARERYDALANAEGEYAVRSYFRGVPGGRIYTLFVGTGRERRAMATLNLGDADGPVKISINAPPLGGSPDLWIAPRSDANSGDSSARELLSQLTFQQESDARIFARVGPERAEELHLALFQVDKRYEAGAVDREELP